MDLLNQVHVPMSTSYSYFVYYEFSYDEAYIISGFQFISFLIHLLLVPDLLPKFVCLTQGAFLFLENSVQPKNHFVIIIIASRTFAEAMSRAVP